jgi:hypothetical protein
MKLQFRTQFVRITLIVLQLINPSLQWPEPEYSATPIPAPWPEQFHALLYMNLSSTRLQITNLWYDWPRGRNVNIIQKQLSVLLYDTEWNNGTTFYYTLSEPHSCRIMVNDVGIPRPDASLIAVGLWLMMWVFLGLIFLMEPNI